MSELEIALARAPKPEQVVTQEITYYKLTHQSEFSANRQRFRIRGITHDEKLRNLQEILSTSEENIIRMAQVGHLPTNAEALRSLNDQAQLLQPNNAPNDPPPRPEPHPFELLTNSIVAVVWIINDKKVCLLGCIIEYNENDDVALVDYLERVTPGNNEYWRYPRNSDTSETGLNQIMGIEPRYDWEYSSRSQKLKLKNCAMVADYSLRVTLE